VVPLSLLEVPKVRSAWSACPVFLYLQDNLHLQEERALVPVAKLVLVPAKQVLQQANLVSFSPL
jgi:hypothetical protein